ncbi:MAG: hypothetical protein JNK42_05600 [Caedimonas sp.]|jgi:hypothetical protein|nr:hypothetical protein [Caedimonas sp.]
MAKDVNPFIAGGVWKRPAHYDDLRDLDPQNVSPDLNQIWRALLSLRPLPSKILAPLSGQERSQALEQDES